MRAAVSDAILEAAEQVALESGLEAATTAAIAARAGVAVGTLYNYFPDRDGILAALVKTRRAEILPKIEAASRAHVALPFADQLRAYLRELLGIFEAHRRFLELAMLADREGMKIKGRDMSVLNKMLADVEAIFRLGAAKKLFPAPRAESYARMFVGSVKALLGWRIEKGLPLADDVDLVTDLWLKGVGGV